MDTRHGQYTADILEQSEEIKDNNELLEEIKKKIKRINITLVIELIVFLIIILVRCSAGLEQNTVIPSKVVIDEVTTSNGVLNNEATPVDDSNSSEEPLLPEEPEQPKDDKQYSITVDRIDIAINDTYSLESSDLMQRLKSEAGNKGYTRPEIKKLIDDFNLQKSEYSIKSVENVFYEGYATAGNSVTVDSELGLNGGVDTKDGHLIISFVADESQVPVEQAYGDNTVGYLMYKVEEITEKYTDDTSIVLLFNTDSVDTHSIAQAVTDYLTSIEVPIGSHHIQYIGLEGYKGFLDTVFFGEELKPVIDSASGMESDLYISKAWGNASANGYYLGESDGDNRGAKISKNTCTLTADDETPNVYAVIINIDGYSSSAEYTAPNCYTLEDCITKAESEGFHK